MSREIPLTKNKVAIVDDQDYADLMKYRWFSAGRYAARHQPGTDSLMYMHRHIKNPPKDMQVDHVNGDPLDNRRQNLRVCTRSENARNTKPHKDRKHTKYKGVTWVSSVQRWQAQINVDGKPTTLGRYKDENDAARAYNRAATEHFGEFAYLNEIEEDVCNDGRLPCRSSEEIT